MAGSRCRQWTQALIIRTSSAHDAVVFALAAACRTGDAAAIRALLAPDVVAVVDGDGERTGPTSVSRLLVEFAGRDPRASVSVESVNGHAGLAYRRSDRVVGVAALSLDRAVVDRVWLVLSPDKLGHWTRGHFDLESPDHQEYRP